MRRYQKSCQDPLGSEATLAMEDAIMFLSAREHCQTSTQAVRPLAIRGFR
jgi:hypothetical protein